MKKSLITSIVLLLFFIINGCGSSEQKVANQESSTEIKQTSIVVYGSNTCTHCIQFKAKLDSVGLPYVFNDVDVSDEQALIMVDLVKQSGFKGRIMFPVVQLNGEKVLIAPELTEVLNYIN